MRDVFVETPPMSTHMVAFVISGFNESTSGGLEGESPIHTFTQVDYLDQIRYVSEKAPELLKAMEDFTEIQYNMPKFDMFAVPDFKSNSMGNWGLTTFRYLKINLNFFTNNLTYCIILDTSQA